MDMNTYKCYKGHVFESDASIWRSKCPECGMDGVLFAQVTEDFVEAFAGMFDNEATSDVILVTEGKTFFGHKTILAARSKYFRKLFYGGPIKFNQDRVELEEAASETFGILLKYVYTGKIELDFKNFALLLDLFSQAHRYQIEKLQKYLEEYFLFYSRCYLNEVTAGAENVCSLLSLALRYSLNKIVINCCVFVHKNIEIAFLSNDAGHLSKEAFCLVLAIEEIYSKLSVNTFAEMLTKWRETHPIGTLSNTFDGDLFILKPFCPAMKVRAEANEMVVSNSSLHLTPIQESTHVSEENTKVDVKVFKCWFDSCLRNPFPSEQARNIHFHEHMGEYIRTLFYEDECCSIFFDDM